MSVDDLWYKDAVFYELHVKAFYDGNGDGVGDFRGLTEKLDYLQDLGIDCLWILPFYPSPLRDDGYDIADYYNVHPSYGTLADFRAFLKAAHHRGIRVITDLVMNHTSDQHPWFQDARRSPDSRYRNYYVWSQTYQKYADARIIFTDTERSNWSWDMEAGAYYWHRFFSHQPDLNYDNSQVRRAMLRMIRYWLDMGIDGFRLDAVPYLYEREGTNCENLGETHTYLREVRQAVEKSHPGRVLLCEANQWPQDVRAYFGDGDECHMAFNFPVMPRLFMSLRREDRFPIVDIIEQTPGIPAACQWGLFLRNHDELTLEMVTDDERDYMYHEYATDPRMKLNLGIRRRLAPLLGNGRRQIELMTSLLFTLPGSPIIYYGDELGMGDNIYLGDRNGVRTPMQWSGDRNAGFSRADTAALYSPLIMDPLYGYQAVNVEAQLRSPSSLLNWTKRMIRVRKRYPVFGRGSIEFLRPENRKVLAYLRSDGEQTVLVVANLSRFSQPVELDLQRFQGMGLVELIGEARFPVIREAPYFLSLGPHGFYWFRMEKGIDPQE
jgi:maltose alpha-D-glucosyltransferase/alpha-amylase